MKSRWIAGAVAGLALTAGVSSLLGSAPAAARPSAPAAPGDAVAVPIAACRVFDTRTDPQGMVLPGETRTVQITGSGPSFEARGGKADGCGIPADAVAVEATVTAVSPSAPGYARISPSGIPTPTATFLNYPGQQSVTNSGTITLNDTGRLDLRNYDGVTDLVLDVQAYYAAAGTPDGSAYVPIRPCRVVDTREAGGPLDVNTQRTWQVGGDGPAFATQGGKENGCGVPPEATAVKASVSAVTPKGVGRLLLGSAGADRPLATFLSHSRSGATNTGLLPLSREATPKVAVEHTGAETEAVVDVLGYFVPEGTGRGAYYRPLQPCRLLDTRKTDAGAFTRRQLDRVEVVPSRGQAADQGGAPDGCGVPRVAEALEVAVSGVDPRGSGFTRLWPTNDADTPPIATVLNYADQQSNTNTATVPVSPTWRPGLTLANYAGTADYVIDVQGAWVPREERPEPTRSKPPTDRRDQAKKSRR